MAISQSRVRPQQMYLAQQSAGRGGPSGLADVLEVLLDKGLVIDAFVRVSLVGIELLTVDARIVIASVDTYLRFAEAVNRLDLLQANRSQQLDEVIGGGQSSSRSGGGKEQGSRALSGGRKQEEEKPSDQPREQEASQPRTSERSETSEREEAGDGGEGILSKIKERGRVF
jgi:gas vesicle structural protein